MDDTRTPVGRRRWRRTSAAIGTGIVVVVVLGVLVVHTPPFRAFVLRQVSSTLAASGIQLEAARLDYNLATAQVALSGVRVSAAGETPPFFEADAVGVQLSSSVFRGVVEVERVTVAGGVVRVVQREDGRSNLPPAGEPAAEDPAPLRFGRLLAPDLAIEFTDEARDIAVRVPSLRVELSEQGRIGINAPVTLRVGPTTTTLAVLESALGFDGRDVRFDDFRLEAPEGHLELNGTLALLRRAPSIDARVSAEVDLARAAQWGVTDPPVVGGLVRLTAAVRGPLERMSADVTLASGRVAWAGVDVTDVAVEARADAEAVTITQARFGVAGGQVSATGALAFGLRVAELEASWREVGIEPLVARVATAGVSPTGRASGELAASGSLDGFERWTARAGLRIGQGRNGEGRLSLPGETRLEMADGAWRLNARHLVGGALPIDASLQGRFRSEDVSASPIDGELRLASTGVDEIARVLSTAGLALADADQVSGAVAARVVVGGTFGQPTLRFETDSDRLTLVGQPFENVRARGLASLSRVEIESVTADQPPVDGQSPTTGRLEASGGYDLTRGTYDVAAMLTGWRLLPTPDLPFSAAIDGTFQGTGEGTVARGGGQLALDGATWQGVALGALTATIALEGDQATVEARAVDFDTVVTGTVATAAPFATSLRVAVETLDLARLLTLAGLDSSVQGTTSLTATAEGSLEDWRAGRAAVEVQTLEAREGDLVVGLSEPARLRYEDERIVVDRLRATAGETVLSASGALPVSAHVEPAASDAVRVTMTGNVDDVIRTASLAGVAASAIVGGEGPVTLNAQIAGTIGTPVLSADLNLGPASVQLTQDLPPIRDVQVRAHLEGDHIELLELVASFQGARLIGVGDAPLALFTGSTTPTTGGAVFQARLFELGPATLASVVDAEALEQITGTVDVTLDVRTPSLALDDLEADLVLERFDLAVTKLPIRQTVPTRITARNGVARVETWRWAGEGAAIEVLGQVRLQDQAADLEASGRLDLRMLSPWVRGTGLSTAGVLETRVSITGALGEPVVTGDLRIREGEFRLADPGVVASDVELRALLTRNQVSLTSLGGTINGGALSGTGEVRYAPEIEGRIEIAVQGMALEFPEGLRSEIDADLDLGLTAVSGQAVPDGRVGGTVTVTRSAYREPLALVTGLLANLRSATAAAAARTESPFLDRLALDVRVVTDDDLVIRNNVARAQIGADLRVIGTASAPTLSGRAELREGGQLFLGRNTYAVQSGTIDFANPVTIEPNLGIVAGTRAGGEDIEIRISGTPETLTTDLSSSSNPELGQADITSLLLTGRRMDELGSAEAAAVGAQLLGNLSGDVLGFAGRAVGLDTLRVGGVDATDRRDPADLAAEVDPTSRLTFGKSLGSNLDVTLSQSLRDGDAQTWIIDYLPRRQVALRLVSNDEDLRSYAFRHDLVFGAAPSVRSNAGARADAPRVSIARVQGDLGFPEAQLLNLLRLEVGDRFDFIDWQADLDRLERFYRDRRRLAARVRANREETAGGVELVYDIQAGPETVIEVKGIDVPGRVVAEIETAWAESVFDGFLTEEAAGIVRRELGRTGYLQPAVEVHVEEADGVRRLGISVAPGEQTLRTEVRVEGVDDPLGAELTEIAAQLVRDTPSATVPQALGRGLVDYLRQSGYSEADVRVAAPVFDGPEAVVRVSVSPGALFTIGAVTIEGTRQVPVDDVGERVGLATASPYSQTAVDAARARVQGYYRTEGFAAATVDARPLMRSDASVVDVTFVVAEGPRQTVGEVAITGTGSVDDDVVTRALRLPIGAPLLAADWLEARQRLFETGLFRRVDVALEPVDAAAVDAEATVRPMRVRVLVEEWPTLRLRYGFQVAEERPEEDVNGRDLVPGVSADLTRRTLFRRAITIGGAAQYERRERLGRLFLSTPNLWGLPVQSSFVLERSRRDFAADTLVVDRTSASWEQRTRRGALSLSYALRYERNHTFDTESPIDSDFPVFDLTVDIARLTSSAAWDTRDDPADTTSGTLVSTTVEHASGALGSDLFFVRSLSQAYHFRSWRGVVLASAGRFGAVRPLGGQAVIPSQRFFAGGARTVRGVKEDGLGGVDFFGNPLGGKAMLVLNQEARFPIYRWVRGVVFLDAGSVFAELGDIGFGALTGAGGLGLRITTPFAVLRVDYGKPLWRAPEDASGQWIFGIGHTF